MNVLIAGGGIGGLTAALAFQQFGHTVTVFEQSNIIGEVGAGLQISPNGMRVLSILGVASQVAADAFRPKAMEMRMGKSGRTVFSLPLRKAAIQRWGADYLHVYRPDLIEVLKDALLARAPNALQLGKDLQSYEQTESGITVRFTDGTSASGDLLIGADGIHSSVRTQMLGPDRPRYTGMVAWRAVAPVSELGQTPPPPTACVWTGSKRHAVTYLLRRGSLANFVGVVERKETHIESWSAVGAREDALNDFKKWNPAVRGILEAAETINLWALYDRDELSTWRDGRAVLLGDACHPMLPFMAQGAVMAIEDAYILAREVDTQPSIASALETYEALRKPRTTKIQLGARGRAHLFHRRNPLTQLATYGPMWLAGRTASRTIYGQNDWLFSYDAVTDGAG